MKRTLILALLGAIALSGCGGGEQAADASAGGANAAAGKPAAEAPKPGNAQAAPYSAEELTK